MKWKRRMAVILACLLITGVFGAPIAVDGKSPAATPSPTPTDEVAHEGKVSGKWVRTPPFVITVEDKDGYDASQSGVSASQAGWLTMIGQCDDDRVDGAWQFSFRFRYVYASETEKMVELVGGLGMGVELTGTGTADATMAAPEKKKKTTPSESAKNGDPLAPLTPDGPPASFSCTFETTMALEIVRPESAGSISGFLMAPTGESRVDARLDLLGGQGGGTVPVKARINVFGDDRVRVAFSVDGKPMYFDGVLTSEKELDVRRKESWKWPIWGVWTDRNPYEPMPNVPKDLEALKEKPDKKIAYPLGQWLMLKAGRKDDPSTYAFVQSTDSGVVYEQGEIWPYPGSARFVPRTRKEMSKDLRSVQSETVPDGYAIDMTYRTATDSLWVPAFGHLVRVRDAILYGAWSTAGDVAVPQKGQKASVPDGTWLEFSRDTSENAQAMSVSGYSGQSLFTRTVIRDGTVQRVDTGTAITMPIAEEEMVHLVNLVSTIGDQVSELPDETLLVTQYDKAAGTVDLNQVSYTSVTGAGPGGVWCSAVPVTRPPDAARGAVLAMDPQGAMIAPDPGTVWMQFNNKAKTFTRTTLLDDPIGYLVETGRFRTVGGNVLVLFDMTAGFFPDPEKGDLDAAFQNRPNTIGEQVLPFEKTKDDGLQIGGIGTLHEVPEE